LPDEHGTSRKEDLFAGVGEECAGGLTGAGWIGDIQQA